MAKAKKQETSDSGATRKQATGSKKAAKPPAEARGAAAAPNATKSAATTTRAAASAEKQPAAGGAATKKKAPAKPTGGGAPSSVPLIDTSLAAATAATFVMNRALLGNAAAGAPGAGSAEASPDAEGGAPADEKRESSAFKQMKAGLNKPAVGGPGGVLGGPTQGKKGNTPFGGANQQTGRNQTFGADVNRAGVPRRTGG